MSSIQSGPRGQSWKHPNPRPPKVIDHRGIKWTTQQWADFLGVSKSSIRDYERRGYLAEMLDHALQKKGLLP